MGAGALWGLVPGYLKARFNVNEIISTLMMNYIAVAWVNFWIFAVWTEGGFQMTPKFPDNASLPRLSDYAGSMPIFRGLTTHLGLLLGILAAVLLWVVIYRSRWGYEIRLIGDPAARYAGIGIMLIRCGDALGALAGNALWLVQPRPSQQATTAASSWPGWRSSATDPSWFPSFFGPCCWRG
jgi:simple sugar transport system permease protein